MRTMLLAMLALSVALAWMGWKVEQARSRRRAVEWVRQTGGRAIYDAYFDGRYDNAAYSGGDPFELPEPGWLSGQLGRDFFDKVVSVRLEGESITDISPLAELNDMRKLDLVATQVADLSPLAGMTSLESLVISGRGTYDWSAERWRVARTPVTDLSPLSETASLTGLRLNRTSVSDVSPLASLTSLRHLILIDSPVSDLKPLAGLASLRSFSLRNSAVSDLKPLAGMSGLEALDLSGTQVKDLSPLAGMNRLERLNLQATAATDLTPLAGLTRIKWLDFNAAPSLSDISPLAHLAGLEHLDLSFTSVSDVSHHGNTRAASRVHAHKSGSRQLACSPRRRRPEPDGQAIEGRKLTMKSICRFDGERLGLPIRSRTAESAKWAFVEVSGYGDEFIIGLWPRHLGVYVCASCKSVVNIPLESGECQCGARPAVEDFYDYALETLQGKPKRKSWWQFWK